MPRTAGSHYDFVTDAWKEFMGDHFHFGYFETEDTELSRATEIMIEKMLELCDVSGGSRILDVGCGIGGPAFYIHEKFNCAIDGISTSERGVELASITSKEKGYHDVNFKVANGLSNGFPDSTFDIVWIMETSHLIPNRVALFRECSRVLKENGTIVLCDLVVLMRPIYRVLWHAARNAKKYVRNLRAWGPAQLGYPGNYCDSLITAGFREVTFINITEKTLPTMKWWKNNALRYRDSKTNAFSKEDVQEFIYGCETVEELFNDGVLGYGIVRANK